MNWADFPFRINEGRPTRLIYGDGDLDFLDLPVPILHVAAGPLCVTLQTVGGLYVLWSRTTPADIEDGWTVTLVWR